MDIKFIFGKQLKKIRKQKKLSQEKLAEISNIDRSTLSDIERGTSNPSLETLNKLSKGLKVSLSELFDFEKEVF